MPEVRTAQRADLPRLVDIYNHYVVHAHSTFDTEPLTVAGRTPWFDSFAPTGPHRLLVACEGEQVLGYACSFPYRTHPAFAHTVEFGVCLAPENRGRGVGSALYRELLARLSAEPVHVAVAAVALPNEASVALHRKFGFTEVGVFHEYAVKHGDYLSSVWLQRLLPGAGPEQGPE